MKITEIWKSNTQKRRGTLPKIAYPVKKSTSDAEFLYDTSPTEKEKGVNDRKDDKNKKFKKDKDPVFPDDTAIFNMEEDIIEKKNDS